MNEKLIVKNFGPIKDAELDLKKVTVFIGPQGSGKSTLAKLVAICKDGDFLTDSYIGKNTNMYFEKFQTQFFLNLNSNTNFSFSTQKFSFEFSTNLIDFKILDSSEITDELFGQLSQTFESMKDTYKLYLESLKQKQAIYKILYPNDERITRQIIAQLIPDCHYIPTERLLISSISDSILGLLRAEVALQKSTIDFGANFELARVSIKKTFIDYLNVTYEYSDGKNLVYYNKVDSLPLSASASGYQSTIPLHLVVDYFSDKDKSHIIVEEPELNLFPTTQKKLIGYLVEKCAKWNNELLITTHSPYVLSSLNILLFAYQVANKYPESAEEVEKLIPREQWINPDDFAAYYVGEDEHGDKGGVHSIFNRNKQTQLIGENELDEISDELGDEFNELMNIYRTKKRETVN